MKIKKMMTKIKHKLSPAYQRSYRDFHSLKYSDFVCKHGDYKEKTYEDRSYDKRINTRFDINIDEEIVRMRGRYNHTEIFLIIDTMSKRDYKNGNKYEDCKIKTYRRDSDIEDFFKLSKKTNFVLQKQR